MYKKFKDDIRVINKIAIPILAGCIVQTIFSITDQAIIGRTNIEGFAAVGVASNILYVLTGAIGILSSAFSILFGKRIVLDNKKDAEKIFNTSINFGIILGIIFGITALLFSRLFFLKIYNFNGETLKYSFEYMQIASWGVGLNILIFILSAYFRNLKKMKIYFYATIISLTVNFIFDYILVFGKFGFPELGVKGAAIGTILGLLTNTLIYIIIFLKTNYIKYKFKIYKIELFELIKIYIPLLGQEFIESTLFVLLITYIITNLNIKYVAAYNLTDSINNILLLPLYIYSGAISPLVVQTYSKLNFAKAKIYPIIASIISLLFLIVLGGVAILFSNKVCSFITNDIQLITLASSLLPVSILMQFFNIPNQIYKYCLQGTADEKWVLGYSIIISSLFCIAIYVNAILFNGGIISVYRGLGSYYLVLGIGYAWKFFSKTKLSSIKNDRLIET